MASPSSAVPLIQTCKNVRAQLSAARIFTGLRNPCPKNIVLYEADLRRNACLVKYYSKLFSLGFQNHTSKFLGSWRLSPLGHAVSGLLVAIEHRCLS
ncbi:RNase H domain-containing protein [Trichonephila clavipes]|nr:RNase H domain-containing protein [Trichonephila clavipes]